MWRELPTGEGFADLVFLPRKNVDLPALVVELKKTSLPIRRSSRSSDANTPKKPRNIRAMCFWSG